MAAGNWKDLLKAIQENNLELVHYHVAMDVDLNYQHPEFMVTPLIEAADYGRTEIVKYLLANGADPKIIAGFNSETALSVAKAKGHTEIVEILNEY
ncbi:MAG: ankyrin repeat protein [Arenicella sp.]|jgi:ankyrin repeat protein